MIYQEVITFLTNGRGTIDITDKISAIVKKHSVTTGICHLFIHHTSASIILCENYDTAVRTDLEKFISQWIPDDNKMFKHTTEGADDMPAHLRSIFTHSDLTIPITNKKLVLGSWQGIFLWEHRYDKFQRHITVTILGE